jgi:hypothetical protein
LIQSLRDDNFRSGSQGSIQRREEQPPQAGAKGWQANALSGIGQQDLLNHLRNMACIVGLRRLSRRSIDRKWISDVSAYH